MKLRSAIFLLLIFANAVGKNAFAQTDDAETRVFSYVTIYYVDNSDGFEADALNDELVSLLRENLEKLTKRPDNYFLFYGCDGDENKISNNLTGFLGSSLLKKYLANPSNESGLSFNKSALREYFSENLITAKQNVELNVYLSTHAIKRMLKDVDEVPVSVFLNNELPKYVTSAKYTNTRVKVKYFINKEAEEKLSAAEINKLLYFCSKPLKLGDITTEVEFL